MHIRNARTSDLSIIEYGIHKTPELQTPSGHDLGKEYNKQLIKNGIDKSSYWFLPWFTAFCLASRDRVLQKAKASSFKTHTTIWFSSSRTLLCCLWKN